jgi:hypothetical protein
MPLGDSHDTADCYPCLRSFVLPIFPTGHLGTTLTADTQSLSMVNLENNNQNSFFFQRLKRGISQCICISGETLNVFFKSERRVGVDQMDAVLYLQAMSREVPPIGPPHDRRTAKGIGELLGERVKQILIGLLR